MSLAIDPAPRSGANSLRDQNRHTIMELILSQSAITRVGVAQTTGLSRSTISRVADELLAADFVVETDSPPAIGRGRPSRALKVSPSQGHVVGLDVGVATVRMLSSDLNGDVIARDKKDTPSRFDVAALADWLVKEVRELPGATAKTRLRQVVMSFPAKIVDDVFIEHPPTKLRHIGGSELFARISHQLGVPLMFRTDPDMALRGEMKLGKGVGEQNIALFIVSAAIGASIAIDGKLLGGDRRIIGQFGRMPYGSADLTLDDVLSIEGITARAQTLGFTIDDLGVLTGAPGQAVVRHLRADFIAGLTQMIVAVTLSVEPRVIIFAGRLLHLIEDVLPTVHDALADILPVIPRLVLSEAHGYSQPRGAAEVALEATRKAVLADVAAAFADN